MFYEKIDLKADVRELRKHFEKVVRAYPPVLRKGDFGGWSITSSTGDYRDGWVSRSSASGRYLCGKRPLPKSALRPVVDISAYSIPTQVCTGYLSELFDQIRALGLFPRRARISLIPAGFQAPLHRDRFAKNLSVRLHVPFITNRAARFEYDGKSAHFPADGSGYLVRTHLPHRSINLGSSDRLHLVMSVFDLAHVTKRHGFYTRQDFRQSEPSR